VDGQYEQERGAGGFVQQLFYVNIIYANRDNKTFHMPKNRS
jgi:hypothetical protein